MADEIRDGAAQEPLIDGDQLALLRDALGDADLFQMLRGLPAAVEQGLGGIDQAMAAGDLDALRRSAHRLKGTAGSFGAARLAAIARELELGVMSLDAAASAMLVLRDIVAQTLSAFRHFEHGGAEAAP
jgi:HPt (histidine-containing phosphotransfer) domain-containing protein